MERSHRHESWSYRLKEALNHHAKEFYSVMEFCTRVARILDVICNNTKFTAPQPESFTVKVLAGGLALFLPGPGVGQGTGSMGS